jgi:hypothetical protein
MLVLQVQLAKESNQKFFSKKGVSLGHPFFVKGKKLMLKGYKIVMNV